MKGAIFPSCRERTPKKKKVLVIFCSSPFPTFNETSSNIGHFKFEAEKEMCIVRGRESWMIVYLSIARISRFASYSVDAKTCAW